jgi:hypothetical protein
MNETKFSEKFSECSKYFERGSQLRKQGFSFLGNGLHHVKPFKKKYKHVLLLKKNSTYVIYYKN